MDLVTLSDSDRRLLNVIVQEWDEAGAKLPGDISYKMLYDLPDKLGLDRPQRLEDFIRRASKGGG